MESCISLITALYWKYIKNSEKKLNTFEGLLYNTLHYLLILQERFTFWNNALEDLEFFCRFFTRGFGVIDYYNRGEIDGRFYSHLQYFQETAIARIWKNLFIWRKSASFACKFQCTQLLCNSLRFREHLWKVGLEISQALIHRQCNYV